MRPVCFALMFLLSISTCAFAKYSYSAGQKWPTFPPGSLTIDGMLTIDEFSQIKNLKIGSVTCIEDADSHTFDSSKTFNRLFQVTLKSSSNNQLLKKLSKNYSRIKILSVIENQMSPIDPEFLSDFSKLDELYLSGPLVITKKYEFPKSVVCLRLDKLNFEAHNFSNCSNLVELYISSTRLNKAFFQNLHAPKLKQLSLLNVEVENGALSEVENKFKKLKTIFLKDSSIYVSDLKAIAALPNVESVRTRKISVVNGNLEDIDCSKIRVFK